MGYDLPATVPQGAWGTENASPKDLVVPRIKICQATSQAAKDGLALPGQLVHGSTNEVLAKKGDKLELLPILCVGNWSVSRVPQRPGEQPEFIRQEVLTPENDSDNWSWEGFENDQPIVKKKMLSFLMLMPSRVHGFPMWIDFTKTNKKGGMLLSTILQENKVLGKPAPSRVVEVHTTTRTYKNNSWFVYSVAPGREATQEELKACHKWYQMFNAHQVAQDVEGADDDGIR